MEPKIIYLADFHLLKIQKMMIGKYVIRRQVLEAIDPSKFEHLPVKLVTKDGEEIIGYVANPRREGDWFIGDIALNLKLKCEFALVKPGKTGVDDDLRRPRLKILNLAFEIEEEEIDVEENEEKP